MIQVIDRALDILEYLALKPEEESQLSRIAEYCALNKTTTANILKALENRGYISHPGKKRGYSLGYKASTLAWAQGFFDRITRTASEEVQRLFEEFSETVVLATEHRDRRIILSNLECQVGITARISHSDDLYRSATGRVILACGPEDRAKAIVERLGLPSPESWEGMDSTKKLFTELRRIREDGYSVKFGKNEIVGIAVPIFLKESPVASIGICLPEYRCNPVKLSFMLSSLNESSARISRLLAVRK